MSYVSYADYHARPPSAAVREAHPQLQWTRTGKFVVYPLALSRASEREEHLRVGGEFFFTVVDDCGWQFEPPLSNGYPTAEAALAAAEAYEADWRCGR